MNSENGPNNATEMSAYLREMLRELKQEPDRWENVTLEAYLEALSAAFEDHQGVLLKGHESGSIPYRVLAELLSTATIYE
ncbi:hypothetical protein [Methylosinus sp. RM1]|uniref:DUF7660 family protein n=1 Tax=Methylosinus sp. RM1 TaxID=2583817 RepID=UPI00140DD848|nr:hypothetical protein [Methylosinus sp. RM1]